MLWNAIEFQQEVTQKTGFLGWASSSAQPPLAACHVLVHLRLLESIIKQSLEYSCPPTHTTRTSSGIVSHTTGEQALNSLRQTRPL